MTDILSRITAFSEKEYYRDQMLSEYLRLQEQLFSITFGENVESKSPFLFQEVGDRFMKIYNDNKLLLEDEFKEFSEMNTMAIQDVTRIKKGLRGEYLVKKTLDRLKCKKIILYNQEFYAKGHATEIDSIVITEKGIFIVEVKNFSDCEVQIDQDGGLYNIREKVRFKIDLLEKMQEKEYALAKLLKKLDVRLTKIYKIVVFIDSNCYIDNKCKEIFTTKLAFLNKTIERCNSMRIYSLVEMDRIYNCFKNNAGKRKYSPSVNMEAYKRAFVNLFNKSNEVMNMSKVEKLLKITKLKVSRIIKELRAKIELSH